MAKQAKAAQQSAEQEEPGREVATQQGGAVGQVGDDGGWGDYDGPRGTEDFSSADVTIPRLKLIQELSPEAKDRIANPGDLLHNITKQILCPRGERLPFITICGDKQYILWRDRNDQGGGIMARANRVILPDGSVRYAWDKPNTKFSTKIGGKIAVDWTTGRFVEEDGLAEFGSSVPGQPDSGPAATLHYNYVIMLPTFGNQMVAISLARTGTKKARDLNALLKMGPAPVFARVMELATLEETKDNNTWWNWAFQPKELLGREHPMIGQLMTLHEELKKRGINVDFSDGDDNAGSGDQAGGTRRF